MVDPLVFIVLYSFLTVYIWFAVVRQYTMEQFLQGVVAGNITIIALYFYSGRICF